VAAAARQLELSAAKAFAATGEVAARPAGAALLRTFADLGVTPLRDLSRSGLPAAWQAAAILYDRVHDKAGAARCRQCHDWAGQRDWGALAGHFVASGMPEVAAGYLGRAGRWAEAAAQWESAWDFAAAAVAFERAGDDEAASRCRSCAIAAANGRGAVAIVYEQAGMWERAALVHAMAENWKRAALAWYKLGLAGLRRQLHGEAGDEAMPGADLWPAHWDASVQCYQKARDTVNATRVKRLAVLARSARTAEDWQALAKEAGAD
jgi:hypothetical protein